MINKKKLLLNALLFGFFIFVGILILVIYTDYHNRNLKKDGVLGATIEGLVVNSSLVSVNQVAQGQYDLVIKYRFENHAIYPIKKLQGKTNLQTTFAAYNYQVLSINSGSLHVNSGFNGSSNLKLLTGSDIIQPGASAEVTITVRVFAENFQSQFRNYVDGSGVLQLPPVTEGDGDGYGYGDEDNEGDTGTPTPVPCTTEDPDCGSTDWDRLDPYPDEDPDLNNPCSDPDFDCEGWMNGGGGDNNGGGNNGGGNGSGEEPVVEGDDELLLTLPTPSPSSVGAPTASPTPTETPGPTYGITTPTPSEAGRIGGPTSTPTPTVLGLQPTTTPTPGGIGGPAPSTTPPGAVLGISIPNTSFDIRSVLLIGSTISLLLLALKTYLKKQ